MKVFKGLSALILVGGMLSLVGCSNRFEGVYERSFARPNLEGEGMHLEKFRKIAEETGGRRKMTIVFEGDTVSITAAGTTNTYEYEVEENKAIVNSGEGKSKVSFEITVDEEEDSIVYEGVRFRKKED